MIEKDHDDFDLTDAATGVVTIPLSATDTNQKDGNYIGELKIIFSASNIDLSSDISIKIDESVI